MLTLSACGDDDHFPSAAVEYDAVASAPRFVIPSTSLPNEADALTSNNNVDILQHEGRLFLAWRTGPSHFASAQVKMHVISSTDGGNTWSFEHTVMLGSDIREPRLLSLNGVLQLLFFQAGTNPAAFEPMKIWRTRRLAPRQWSALEILTEEPEVPWDIKVHNGRAYRTSYQGEHYTGVGLPDIRVFFRESTDGTTWTDVGGKPFVYRGGVSEVAFDFDDDGNLWAVTRNEDGDTTGFGSHVCFAPAHALAEWQCSEHSDPERYDSPEMFRHAGELYLIARRDIGGPYDEGAEDLTHNEQRARNLLDYSFRAKRTALYRIDRELRRVEHVMDLPGAGDTAFPAVVQTGPHTFLVANYTSPLDQPDITWFEGQTSARGTQIYLLTLTFAARDARTPRPTPTATIPPAPTPTPDAHEPIPVAVAPVFATVGTPLAITWRAEDPAGVIDFGDGTSGGPETTMHTYDGSGIFRLRAAVPQDDFTLLIPGFVARTDTLATSPLRRFALIEPADALAQGVIRNVIPAFYWARAGDAWAATFDPTGKGALDFNRVVSTGLVLAENGSFTTAPTTLTVELSGARATASGLFVGLREVTFSGTINGTTIQSPITMNASIVIQHLVDVLMQLGGFDQTQAIEFVAGVFQFDKDNPPETAAFRGEFGVQL